MMVPATNVLLPVLFVYCSHTHFLSPLFVSSLLPPHPQPICSLRNQIIARSDVLRKMCDRRTAAAVKFRDLQIENIKGLYDYEIREADSVYRASVHEMKNRLGDELRRRIDRLKREKRAVELAAARALVRKAEAEHIRRSSTCNPCWPCGHGPSRTSFPWT